MAANIVSIQNDLSTNFYTTPNGSNERFGYNVGPSNPQVNKSVSNYNNLQTSTNTLVFPSDRPKYFFAMHIGNYSRTNIQTINRANLTNEASVILPLPTQLQDLNETVWQEEELGLAFGAAAQGAYALKNIGDGSKGALQTLWDMIGSTGELGGRSVAGILGALGSQGLGLVGDPNALLSVLSGYSPNQFLTVLFKGPKYKRHELTWKLLPRSHKEAQDINKIIKLLNNSMAPSLSGGGFFFKFPKIFQLAIFPNSKYLFKFKPCVMESFACNYTPSGVPTFFHQTDNDSNPPEAVEFRMRFLELEFWLQGDYNESENPYDTNGNSLRSVVPTTSPPPSSDDNSSDEGAAP